jgi:LuxR family maltose regulon positive regulatory protein
MKFNAQAADDLIQTKLHRPPLPVDLIQRPRLTEHLDPHLLPSLILISAQAGYGKSTLAKSIVQKLHIPSAWIQLDEHDNELLLFLSYFLSAIQLIFPGAVDETSEMLNDSLTPPIKALTTSLINELNQIKEDYLVVLDDYHCIHQAEIHEVLDRLLLHPPSTLHLVLSTRIDPLLPLSKFRAHSEVVEFRAEDLRFTMDEIQQLLENMTKSVIDEATIKSIEEQTEGWVTGIRLAALAMRHGLGQGAIRGQLSSQNRYVTEYLVNEILSKQAASWSVFLLKTSILDRFNADLVNSVCFVDAESSSGASSELEIMGKQFLEWLQASNLFVISLDNEQEWFRYHHLFQDFLRQELIKKFNSAEILNLHAAAGHWYAQNGWIEEAIYHLLAAGDTNAAVEVVAGYRYNAMNRARWLRLEHWLHLFSNEIVETSAELCMLKAWLAYYSGQFSDIPALLQQIDYHLAQKPNQPVANSLVGEISALRSLIAYNAGDAKEAIAQAQLALELLIPEFWAARVLARVYLAGGLLLQGDETSGYKAIYDALDEEKVQNDIFRATLLLIACGYHWINADLVSMERAAKQCIALSGKTELQQITRYGNFQLGRVYYQRNKLQAAEELFSSVVCRPYQNYGVNYMYSVCGLSMTYQALGKETEAHQVTEAAIAFLLETGNTYLMPIALALKAELAIMQGHVFRASQWAKKLDPIPPLVPVSGFFSHHLTLAKLWVAQNTSTSLEKAAELLSQMQEYYFRTHNSRFLIETLALQAILAQTRGNRPIALIGLEQALKLAQPGGFIRIFVDLGPQMARALSQLKVERELHAYAKQILSAFPKPHQVVNLTEHQKILDPLTNREQQVLELLRARMTNKEIAARLSVSPGTVKGHTIQIYQKLNVRSRRQAVEQAIAMGILSIE